MVCHLGRLHLGVSLIAESAEVILTLSTDYTGPGPAEGSGPHRYVLIIYNQPADFSPPSDLTAAGVGLGTFSFSSYVSSSNLGPLIAATYFTVENGQATVSVGHIWQMAFPQLTLRSPRRLLSTRPLFRLLRPPHLELPLLAPARLPAQRPSLVLLPALPLAARHLLLPAALAVPSARPSASEPSSALSELLAPLLVLDSASDSPTKSKAPRPC